MMTTEKIQDLPAEDLTGRAGGKAAADAVEKVTSTSAVENLAAPAAENGATRMDGKIASGTNESRVSDAGGNIEKPENYDQIFYTAIAAMPKNRLSERAFSAYQKLENEGISYRAIFHPALFTADGVKAYVPVDEHTVVVKNLFLRNDTGTKMYLLVQCYDKHADLKALRAFLGSSRLGFCSEERLGKFLDVTAGSVSPLCIANDKEHRVQLILDADLQNYPVICMHPNDNTGSLYIAYSDLLRFVKDSGHEPLFYRV